MSLRIDLPAEDYSALIKDNERKAERIAELEAENKSLGKHLNASVDRVVELQTKACDLAEQREAICKIVKSMRTKLGVLNEEELINAIRALGDE